MMIRLIFALKGAIRDVDDLFTAPRTVSNRYAQVAARNRVQITYNTSSACHVQCVVSHVVRRDSSAIKFHRVEIT